jgi:hypothetical protein
LIWHFFFKCLRHISHRITNHSDDPTNLSVGLEGLSSTSDSDWRGTDSAQARRDWILECRWLGLRGSFLLPETGSDTMICHHFELTITRDDAKNVESYRNQ